MLSGADKCKAEFGPAYLKNLRLRDPQTEAHFTAYFSGYLENKLHNRLRSRDLAEDVRQETLVRVLEAIYKKPGLKHPERFGAFVNSVCNNVLLEYWRRKGWAGETPELAGQVDTSPDPESAAQLTEEITELRKALVKLQKRDRELLRMIYWDETGRDEISRKTHMSTDNVRVTLHRAKRAVRKYLEEARTPGCAVRSD
jgi:RNA polymerase sigma-70 factor (ECF subfamily)